MKKTFKGLIAVIFAFVLLLGLTGCGDEENAENDNQGGNQKQEQQDDNGTTAGEKWGDSNLTAYVPQPPLDKIGNVVTETKTTISYNTTWTPEEAKAYIEKCRNAGFTNNEVENENSGVHSWTVYNGDKSVRISLSYASNNSGVLNIWKIK